MAKFRVLSLDGGGIRGIITIILMQRLRATPGLDGLLDQVELIAGTSTGGMLALALAKGVDLNVLRELYVDKGADVFDDSWLDDVIDLGAIIGAEYDNKRLTRELKSVMGDTKLGQLQKKVLITTFDLDNNDPDPTKRTWKPKLFHNIPGAGNDNAWLAYKVALYTASAPTYFPVADGYIDGGVYASNPSMCALAQTQDERNTVHPPLGDVVLFSLGTGTSLTYIKGQNLDWGYGQWAKPLINLMLDGTAGIAHYQCKQLLGGRYHRLAPCFAPGKSYPMDDVKHVGEMVTFAQTVNLDETIAWLKAQWI